VDSLGGEAANREEPKFSHVVGAEVKMIFEKVLATRENAKPFGQFENNARAPQRLITHGSAWRSANAQSPYACVPDH
jgi:hypothetical protein